LRHAQSAEGKAETIAEADMLLGAIALWLRGAGSYSAFTKEGKAALP
jgi:hypothetical protein